MDNSIFSIILSILGSLQICNVVVSIGLYYLYKKNKNYFYLIILWLGSLSSFVSDYFLGDLSYKHIYLSFIFDTFSTIAMGQLLSQLYDIKKYDWKRFAMLSFGLYCLSLFLFAFGVRNFTLLSVFIALGAFAPVAYTVYGCLQKFNNQSPKIVSKLDKIFIGIVFVWSIHFLDYPFLRPLSSIEASVFGFSLALFLTYLNSVMFPVVINRHIYIQLNQLLSNQLDSTEKKLDKVQKEIIHKEKLAMVGTLTSGVAHEIKNPLNIIKNSYLLLNQLMDNNMKTYKQMVQDKNLEGLLAKFEQDEIEATPILHLIDKNVTRADKIIKNMLMHTRKENSEVKICSINDIVEEAMEFYFQTNSGIDFEVKKIFNLEAQNENSFYILDVSRAIINLVDNALYALKEKLSSESFVPTLEFKTYEDRHNIYLSIRDNGTGIPAEIIDKIQDPFYTTKPTGSGTGLGMYLVGEIMKKHKGHFQITTQIGEYTKILLSFSKDIQ